MQDIAETAKVSKSTVSRVLNNTTPVNEKKRKAVLAAMEKLNFKPNLFARSLAGGQSMTLGIVTQNIGSPFYDSVTQGIIEGLSDTDYAPIFVDGQWKPDVEKAAIHTLIDRNVDGLVMVGGNLEAETLDQLRAGRPMVIVAKRLPGWEDRSIAIDNQDAARQAVQYLVDLGHRDIDHITGIREHEDAQERLAGYRSVLQQAGIPYNEQLVREGNFSSPSGVLAVESLLMRGIPFTAIFAANDEMALGARLALYRRGIRVPDDVSLIGFDDQPGSAYMTPPLTTIAQPAQEMGMAAANKVLGQLQGNGYQVPPLNVKLVVRESVARLR
jgi:LacI family transcriptional regulator